MATAVVIPKMGMTMEQGTLVEWLVPDGADVSAGDVLFHMVTEKLDCDVEAEAPGRLAQVVAADTTLEPGAVVGWLLAPGEGRPDQATGPARPSNPEAAAPAARPAGAAGTAAPDSAIPAASATPPGRATASDSTTAPARDGGRPLASPNAKRVAAQLGVALADVAGTGPGGRITSQDVEAHAARAAQPTAPTPTTPPPSQPGPPRGAPAAGAARAPAPPASPIARKLAARLGVDLDGLDGTGPGGRITRQDVEAAVRGGMIGAPRVAAPVEPRTAAGRPTAGGARAGESIRLIGMRGTIAQRMHDSLQTMAQLTLGMDVDADRVVGLRAQLRDEWAGDEERRVPTYTDFVLKAVAVALRDHPRLNARVTEHAVEVLGEIHVGLAVSLDAGLVVPVLRHTDELSLAEVALESARLSAAARDGALGLDDLAGSTFSVTTLGAYGVDLFTPIVNPPNVAILGVGRLRDDVGWDGDQPRRVTRLTLSLTFDHRAVDGAPAAEFLGAVRDQLEHPTRLLS